MIDFDNIDDWWPKLAAALRKCLPASIAHDIQVAQPVYVEDARQLLFELADRESVIEATLNWFRGETLTAHHGSRLTDREIESVRSDGVIPLSAESCRCRLVRALSQHVRWAEVSGQLDEIIGHHGRGNRAGNREGQVHLTLSKSALIEGFNHYLTHGAEFDQHVAHALLGRDGTELLSSDGKPVIITVAVSGTTALDAAHPHFTINDLRQRGEIPNVIGDFLAAWSYRLAYSDFQSGSVEVDCGLVFRAAIPPEWIVKIEET